MTTAIELAKSMLLESTRTVIVEGEKANFRPFDKADRMGYAGAEKNAAMPEPMLHDHEDHARIIVSGEHDEPHAVNMEVHTLGDEDIAVSHIKAHKDTWMHKASIAKKALELHGTDHDAVHSALEKHGFSRIV